MESRNKITEDFSKNHFLKNLLVEYEQPKVYSLEEEFSKTKRNRDITPYCIFFGFVLLLIGSTIFITHYLEAKAKQVNIDISDFEDLRLKETLSAAKEKEAELHRKSAELDIKAKELMVKNKELDNKKGEIRNLKNSFDQEVQKIKEQVQEQADLDSTDKKALQRLQQKGQKQIDQVIKSYESKLAQKQAEITRLQEQIQLSENKAGDLKSYQYGLGFYVKDKKALGCVIDPRQRKNIISFFVRDPKIAEETLVNVYRGNDEYIGQLKLIPEGNKVRVEQAETAKSIKPLDWFQNP
jgi:hypothetical protein